MTTKLCGACSVEKDTSEFHTRHDRGGIPNWICKACQKTYSAQQYQKHKAKVNARSADWRKAHPDKARDLACRSHERNYANRMWAAARRRAAKKGVPFTITPSDITLPEYCPVLGLKLDYSVGTKGRKASHNSPNLDRRLPELGYVPGNVLVISKKANTIKSNATPEELLKVANYFWVIS